MSTVEATQFVERLTRDIAAVDSILTYPHPFTDGGMVVVFSDSAGSYSELHAAVAYAAPPAGELHVVKSNDLFLLSVPSDNPLAPLDYPHMVYFLKNRGQVVHGKDLREQIPPPSRIDSMLTQLLDITACWFRNHTVLPALQTYAYASLVVAIDARLRYLMAIAVLRRTGKWDVTADHVPRDFFVEFQDVRLKEAWRELEELIDTRIQDTDWATAVRAVWLFEVFTRGLRRYAI